MLRMRYSILLLGILIAGGVMPLSVASSQAADKADAQEVIDNAYAAVRAMRAGSQGPVINRMLQQAKGVFIVPSLVKGAFIFGGEGGTGVILSQDVNGTWSAPSFATLRSGSFGLQIGVQKSRIFMFFMTDEALEQAVSERVKIGADASVAAIDSGGEAEFSTETAPKDIYYLASTDGGLFVGVSLEGSHIDQRKSHNKAYYGKKISPTDIVINRTVTAPMAADLVRELSRRD